MRSSLCVTFWTSDPNQPGTTGIKNRVPILTIQPNRPLQSLFEHFPRLFVFIFGSLPSWFWTTSRHDDLPRITTSHNSQACAICPFFERNNLQISIIIPPKIRNKNRQDLLLSTSTHVIKNIIIPPKKADNMVVLLGKHPSWLLYCLDLSRHGNHHSGPFSSPRCSPRD